jgi:hypothetical protein
MHGSLVQLLLIALVATVSSINFGRKQGDSSNLQTDVQGHSPPMCNVELAKLKQEVASLRKQLGIKPDSTSSQCYELRLEGCALDEQWRSKDNYLANGTGLIHEIYEPVLRAIDVTPAMCAALCFAGGFRLMGLQFGKQCICGVHFNRAGLQALDQCAMKCSGDSSFVCGGFNRNSVYHIERKPCGAHPRLDTASKLGDKLLVEAPPAAKLAAVLHDWQHWLTVWGDAEPDVSRSATHDEASRLKVFKSSLEVGDRIYPYVDAYFYHFERLMEQELCVLELTSEDGAQKLLKSSNTFNQDTLLSTNTAPIDIIIASSSWRDPLLEWFPRLRAGGWFVIEGFVADSADALDLFKTVQVMHRMYFNEHHTNATIFGPSVDHQFKSLFFWRGCVFIEKGVSIRLVI